jgi:hypothetical protein
VLATELRPHAHLPRVLVPLAVAAGESRSDLDPAATAALLVVTAGGLVLHDLTDALDPDLPRLEAALPAVFGRGLALPSGAADGQPSGTAAGGVRPADRVAQAASDRLSEVSATPGRLTAAASGRHATAGQILPGDVPGGVPVGVQVEPAGPGT